ncbi:MAG: 1,4-dihydroxy-2-naphthoate polyprenyltransferase [Lunatimonas sp.]|uniref:1,4-dihydroxy-2-naphthoate polyprenyltransferase n=1 Tax=Lunatimonas sp. TaxID=2060141 RepID=UPI00263BC8C0|nr:1,4-dihydroxy-2-naphthoate polyprenyltransferase [Lunatimonas sp.]MCC5938226.1 1,4-dihydroxy-2-naphthoate polyprenyltransferase [Lunatimonas sp.]
MEITLTSKKQAWLHAFRLRTLPLALSSIFLGSILAAGDGTLRWEVLLLASLTTVLLQVLSNLANDYGDSVHGADHADRQGPVRAVQSGVISPAEMKQAMILCGVLSLICGVWLLYVAFEDLIVFLGFLALGLLAIFAAINYTTGKNPYGYMGLGDLSVFLFFGLSGVLGTYFLHSGTFNPWILLPACSLGFFSMAVLNINNIRDIESDRVAGKKSIPVRIGRVAAVRYNWLLIIGGNLSMAVFLLSGKSLGGFTFLLVLPLMWVVGRGVHRAESAVNTDPYLKKMALSTLLWVIAFGIGHLFF